VENRRELREVLLSNLLSEAQLEEAEEEEYEEEEQAEQHRKRTKSQILETNVSFDEYARRSKTDFDYVKTDDSTLWNVRHSDGIIGYLDISNPRLWIFHSIGPAEDMNEQIKRLVSEDGSMLDFPWLSSGSLERVGSFGKIGAGFNLKYRNRFEDLKGERPVEDMTMRFWGSAAFELIEHIKRNERIRDGLSLSGIGVMYEIENGYVKEQISSDGRIMVIRGDSIDGHFSIISQIQTYYQSMLNLIESEYRFSYQRLPHGVAFRGDMLRIVFNREIPDLEAFVENMFSTTLPFRLWGVAKNLEPDYVKVKAVDLHSKGKLDFEIEPTELRIYLHEGACGNVITRLFTNLQSSFDAQSKLIGHDGRII